MGLEGSLSAGGAPGGAMPGIYKAQSLKKSPTIGPGMGAPAAMPQMSAPTGVPQQSMRPSMANFKSSMQDLEGGLRRRAMANALRY